MRVLRSVYFFEYVYFSSVIKVFEQCQGDGEQEQSHYAEYSCTDDHRHKRDYRVKPYLCAYYLRFYNISDNCDDKEYTNEHNTCHDVA